MSPTRTPLKPPTRAPRRAQRRGMTLIEVSAVMGVNAALTAAAIGALLALRHVDRDLALRYEQRQVVAQLADQLRRDVRAATELRWDDEAGRLTLIGADGGRLQYSSAGNGLQRRRLPDDQSAEEGAAGELAGAFAAAGGVSMAVAPAAAATGEVVRISLRFAAGDSQDFGVPDRVREVNATVGRDARLLHP